MLRDSEIKKLFFLGIGGIGMSALARYFHRSYPVCGYDRTPSPLTRQLEAEGIRVTYEDTRAAVDGWGLDPGNTLVVRTPAVPEDSAIYTYLREAGFDIRKRAEVLGLITRNKKALCVAGTHGKTTTSTMLAHILNVQNDQVPSTKGAGVNAFLGGISMNYGTNVLISSHSEYAVVEADEYDRSFHHLTPYISVITAADPDHLDIYGTPEAYRESFEYYTSLITGMLVMKHGLPITPRLQPGVRCYTYGVVNDQKSNEKSRISDLPDFYADTIRVTEGTITFDFHTPEGTVSDIRLGVPVWVNIENAVAAISVAWLVEKEQNIPDSLFIDRLRESMASFRGVQRRFNIHVHTPRVVYIDDYAHHPQEIATSIDSIRRLFPSRRLIGVFQPHLYTRTRDFAEGFKQVLHTMDELILLPIYPAREEPIPGVTSEMLGGRVVEKKDLLPLLRQRVEESTEPLVILTVGAGDIDRLVPEIAQGLTDKQK